MKSYKTYRNVLLRTIALVLGLGMVPVCAMQDPKRDQSQQSPPIIFDGGEFGDQQVSKKTETLAQVPVSQKPEQEYSFANDPRQDFLGCGEF